MITMLPAHDCLRGQHPGRRLGRLAILSAALAMAFASGTVSASDVIDDINKLMRAGQYNVALQKTEAVLSKHPDDAHLRFTKGLILAEQHKTAEAISIFRKLTEDFPDLPEPYNNLAVLYASQGEYDKAQATLNLAFRTNQTYATTLQNLGDVYARLASEAYQKALQVDKKDSAPKPRLAMVHSFRGNITGGMDPHAPLTFEPLPASTPEPQEELASADLAPRQPGPAPAQPADTWPQAGERQPGPPAKPVPPAGELVMPQLAARQPAPATAVKETPKPAEPAPVVRAEPPKSTATPAPQEDKPTQAEPKKDTAAEQAVLAAVNSWANAWSERNVSAYISHYSPHFKVPKKASRKNWEKERRARITEKAHIEVKVSAARITVDGKKATARFRQTYTSDSLTTSTRKTMEFELRDGKWLITEEIAGR